MKNTLNIVEDVSIGLGLSIGITEIKTILGVVLLVFQIGLIIYKMIRAIIKHAKNKQYDEIDDDLNNGIKQIEEHLNSDKDKKDGK